jgi:hypothetical protein
MAVAVVNPDGTIWGVIEASVNDVPPVEGADMVQVPPGLEQKVHRNAGNRWRYNRGLGRFEDHGQ